MKPLVFLFVFFLSACAEKDGLSGIDDKDLRSQNYHCMHAVNLTAAELQVCKNVRRECEKRAAKGNYVC